MWDPASNIVLGMVLLATFGAAGWLAVELFPRRRGQTPHCRRCGYNLTGLDLSDPAARCPECGALIARRLAVVTGERRFRPRRLAFAALLCALFVPTCSTLIYARATDLDWLRASPSWLLLHLAIGALPIDSERALLELGRRREAGLLSLAELAEFADICLVHHGAAAPNRSTLRIATDALGDLLLAGELSPAQQERFLDNALALRTSVRQPLVTGMNACVRIAYSRRLPPQLTMTVQLQNRTLDGQGCAMAPGPTCWSAAGSGPDGQLEQVLLLPPAGSHAFAVEAEAVVAETARPAWQAVSSPGSRTPILLRARKTVTATIDVREGDPASFVRPIETPAAQEAAAAVHVAGVLHRPSRSAIEVCITLLEPSSVWMIFDARLLLDDGEIDLGAVSLSPAAESRIWTLRATVDRPLPDIVGVDLRANHARARQEAVAVEFFAGSLRFDVVPVVREQPDGGYFLPGVMYVPAPPDDADCTE